MSLKLLRLSLYTHFAEQERKAEHLWVKVHVGKQRPFVVLLSTTLFFATFVFIQDGFKCKYYLDYLFLYRHPILGKPACIHISSPRSRQSLYHFPSWLQFDSWAAILAPELASHGAPGGCSVVSVDPVGLAAATSGYWVSAGGHIDRSTWWWHSQIVIGYSNYRLFSH